MEIFSTLQFLITYLVSTFLLFFIMLSHLTFGQDFRYDSILLERKTMALYDSADISIVKKVKPSQKRGSLPQVVTKNTLIISHSSIDKILRTFDP